MQIQETVNRWFEETVDLMKEKVTELTSVDALCTAAIDGARDYSNAVFVLLSNKLELPAKALLRALCELTVKLSWCLLVPDQNSNETDELVKEKIRRWEKSTLCENIRTLKTFLDVASRDVKTEIQKVIDDLTEKPLYSDDNVDRMPNFRQLFDQLPKLFRDQMYPRFYSQFNNAVHLDVTSLVDSYKKRRNVGVENGGDIDFLIRYCVAHAFHINSTVRLNYDLNISGIKSEYNQLFDS